MAIALSSRIALSLLLVACGSDPGGGGTVGTDTDVTDSESPTGMTLQGVPGVVGQ